MRSSTSFAILALLASAGNSLAAPIKARDVTVGQQRQAAPGDKGPLVNGGAQILPNNPPVKGSNGVIDVKQGNLAGHVIQTPGNSNTIAEVKGGMADQAPTHQADVKVNLPADGPVHDTVNQSNGSKNLVGEETDPNSNLASNLLGKPKKEKNGKEIFNGSPVLNIGLDPQGQKSKPKPAQASQSPKASPSPNPPQSPPPAQSPQPAQQQSGAGSPASAQPSPSPQAQPSPKPSPSPSASPASQPRPRPSKASDEDGSYTGGHVFNIGLGDHKQQNGNQKGAIHLGKLGGHNNQGGNPSKQQQGSHSKGPNRLHNDGDGYVVGLSNGIGRRAAGVKDGHFDLIVAHAEFAKLPTNVMPCDRFKAHGESELVDLCIQADLLAYAPKHYHRCPEALQHDIHIHGDSKDTMNTKLSKDVAKYVRLCIDAGAL